MPRRELLTEAQRKVLTEPATDERTMVRYYTLGAENRADYPTGLLLRGWWPTSQAASPSGTSSA
ncbi:MAG: hypothetical protein JOZ29_19785 [Deltaproteobacteria bacterium]|nr:hypothetical protein [Deltaproteobacteria bacterium]MBV8454491.1 hypothetical protein [Deltaproteobacteria bacterium]